jgi:hypothetical protein
VSGEIKEQKNSKYFAPTLKVQMTVLERKSWRFEMSAMCGSELTVSINWD